MTKYNVGDVVTYQAIGGVNRVVLVTNKESDIKNGLSGFDGLLVDPITYEPLGHGVWGYDHQITSVRKLEHA
jgi:hypothetical protein